MNKDKINQLFRDAIELEINSVIVDGITGRNMPAITPAFLETVNAWVNQFGQAVKKLESITGKISPSQYPIVAALDTWGTEKKHLFKKYIVDEQPYDQLAREKALIWVLNIDTFRRFRKHIERLPGAGPVMEDLKKELFRLQKIQTRLMVLKDRFSELLVKKQAQHQKIGMLRSMWQRKRSRTHDIDDIPVCRETQELRKLWELKDGYIYAQSVVQLDGDVITRYNARMFRDNKLGNHMELLLNIHHKNVDIGLSHWHMIIDTILKIARKFGEKVMNPFK